MIDRRRAGGAGFLALFLLLLVAAGAWNYYRNLAAERAVQRPFQGYAEADLDALAGALRSRSKHQSERYEDAAGRRASPGTKLYFDEQVVEFERVQRVGESKKAAQRELAGSRVTLKLLEEERVYRARERDHVKVFFERLLTL